MRRFALFTTLAAALISFDAKAADTYPPVPVEIINPVEVPGLLENLLAGLRAATDKKDLAAVAVSCRQQLLLDQRSRRRISGIGHTAGELYQRAEP